MFPVRLLVFSLVLLCSARGQADELAENTKLYKAYRSQMVDASACLVASEVLYANESCEPASIVVEAAFGKCSSEVDRFQNAIVAREGVTKATFVIGRYKTRQHAHMLSDIIGLRLAKDRCR